MVDPNHHPFDVGMWPMSGFCQANAQDDATGTSLGLPSDVSLGIRGVGEVWRDPVIIQHYRSSRFAGSGFASVGVLPWLMGEIEVGYMRQDDSGGAGVASGALNWSRSPFRRKRDMH